MESSYGNLKVQSNLDYPDLDYPDFYGIKLRKFEGTVEPRLSGPRLSGLFDYPDFFSGPVFFMNINKL